MEIQGKIKLIGETQSIGSNGFRKRELVVTTEEQYPTNTLWWNLFKTKTDLLDSYQVGQQIKVGINLRGREWINPQGEAKYFNAIQGWRIDNLQQAAPANAAAVAPAQAFEPATDLTADEPNDLPF